MKQFGTILKFELKNYLKNKAFVGITVFLVVAIAVVMFIPNLMDWFRSESSDETSSDELPVLLVYAEEEGLAETVRQAFETVFSDYRVLTAQGSVEQLKKDIAEGRAECAFVMRSMSSYTYYVNNLSMYDTNTATADAVLQEVYRAAGMIQNGLSAEQVGEILSVQIESETEAIGKNQMENFLYTYIMIFALYMVILLYGQMVATNVATEKSSRAMEVLITSAKPTAMMFGKVLASCAAGFLQLFLVFGSAILFYNLNRERLQNPIVASLFDIPMNLFVYMILFFILGFLLYAFLYGAIGSTVSKLEDVNTSVMPITFLFVIAFMIVVFSMSGGSVDNIAMKIGSYIPFTAPMAMFTRICMSTVAWYEIAASVGILVLSTVGVGILSAKIYRIGVLMYGNRPKLGAVLKMLKRS